MVNTYTHKKLTWVDLENPTTTEVEALMRRYHIHPLVVQELLSPTVRPKVDLYDNFVYLILHFPVVTHPHAEKIEQEVDFIIGKEFLITVHYDPVETLHEFTKIFEMHASLDRTHADHGGYLFYYLMREMYKHLAGDLQSITDRLRDIEERIFKREEGRMVEVISRTNKMLLDFRESIRFHREVLESFEAAGKHFFEEKFHYYLRALLGEYYKVSNQLDNQKETLVDLRETNESLLTNKTNEIMKVLTIMSFVILPLSLVTNIFSMNAALPIVGAKHDFAIIMGIMAGLMVCMIGYFKYKKWL